ncbi:MAG: LysR substrate-binding domain-containing protein [Rhodospirillales bacterium]|nr:LysR substrate-binding domain-containing protein [Rhodospirillales bacterium]
MAGLGRLIPSARSLLVFEAAARCGSCGAAAREFNVTQPSVSRSIAQLETHLGLLLFTRSVRGLVLTEEGQALYRAVGEGFERIEGALAAIVAARTRKEVVELSFSTAFVTHWFIPRMQRFYRDFPTVDLRFQLISGTLRGPFGNVDLAMRMQPGENTDCHAWEFAPELVVPVCSPAYLRDNGSLEEGCETPHTLLLFADPLQDFARYWGPLRGPRTPASTSVAFSDYAVVVQAAMNGQGIALGWVSAVSHALGQGTLVPASSRRVATGRAYHLMAPRTRPLKDVTLAIRDWLSVEMQADIARISHLLA